MNRKFELACCCMFFLFVCLSHFFGEKCLCYGLATTLFGRSEFGRKTLSLEGVEGVLPLRRILKHIEAPHSVEPKQIDHPRHHLKKKWEHKR